VCTVDLLAGKTVLVTGIITSSSIAYHVAARALSEGARLVVTGYGRVSLVRRLTQRLSPTIPVIELDVTDEAQLASLADRVGEHTDRLDGVLHSIAYAPAPALGEQVLATGWSDVATTLQVSTYSLSALTGATLPLLGPGSSVVGLDFDAAMAWPGYGWMGVAKAGLESCARYLARELGPRGIRVNLVAAGPLRTLAASGIAAADAPDGRDSFELQWHKRAPLGWDPRDPTAVASTCVALLSGLLPATTGEVVHADGGAHAVGSA
jgi:enoyl-[acyl-carrier protein] reductase I